VKIVARTQNPLSSQDEFKIINLLTKHELNLTTQYILAIKTG